MTHLTDLVVVDAKKQIWRRWTIR